MPSARGTKRSAMAQAAPEQKKPRADPNLAGVLEAIEKAEALPEGCRALLAAVAPNCFTAPGGERHEHQATLVSWIGDALDGVRARLQEAVDEASSEAAGADGTKGSLESSVSAAQAALVAAMEGVVAERAASAEASEGVSVAKAKLSEAQAAQDQAAHKAEELRKEREALEAALKLGKEEDCFDAQQLTAALVATAQQLGLEPSLVVALPAVCAKPPSERGTFDAAVLQQVEAGIEAKVRELSAELEAASSSEDERRAAAEAARGGLLAAEQRSQAAMQQLEAAEARKGQAEAAFGEAEAAVEAFVQGRAPEEESRRQKVAALQSFTDYNLACFAVLRAGA